MPIPDFQTLMLPTLQYLSQRQATTAEVVDALATKYALTEEERHELLPSGRQSKIANRSHWSLAYLNKAGLIVRVARGVYEISALGREFLVKTPERITIAMLSKFPDFAALRGATSGSDVTSSETASEAPTVISPQSDTLEEQLEATDRELKAELAAALLVRLRSLSPMAFEQLIVDLLVKIGYGGSRREAAKRLGRTGDGGIDGVIREDALGLDAVYVQAKRYAEDNTVGAPAIQGFAGALLGHGATKGVFVTTSRFTQQAQQAATVYKGHRIILIDGVELARLMIEYEVGVRTVQTIRVQRIDLEAYDSEEAG
jgi:restriction system protein